MPITVKTAMSDIKRQREQLTHGKTRPNANYRADGKKNIFANQFYPKHRYC